MHKDPEIKQQTGHVLTLGRSPIHFELLAQAANNIELPLQIGWDADYIYTPTENINLIWRELYSAQEAAWRSQQKLFFKPLASLKEWSVSNGTLKLTLGKTFYAAFLATNRNYQYIHAIRSKSPLDPNSRLLANPLNVIAMIVTSDNATLIPKRNMRVVEVPGYHQASVGGAVGFYADHQMTQNEHPVAALCRQIAEEWSVQVEHSDIKLLAFGINEESGEPDLIYLVRVKESAEEMKNAYKKVRSRHQEFQDISKVWHIKENNLDSISSDLHNLTMGAGDQAAALLTLYTVLGKSVVDRHVNKHY